MTSLLHVPMLLAQAAEDLPNYQEAPQINPVAAGIVGILYLAIIVLLVASMWKIFAKAGQPGWASLIPIYNIYVLCKVAGKPGWWVLLMFIPFVNFVILLLVSLGVAERFEKGAGFGLGLFFLSFIFYPILAFGDSRYMGGAPVLPTPAPAY